MKIEKVTLIGLGAMGVFFAPRISEKLGAGFRILADGARKERLEHKGVTVNQINYRFPIITPDLEGDPADLIIIAVKGYDLPQALKDIKNQVGEHTIILSVLNGVESEKQVAEVYGAEHVLYSYMRISIVMKDGKTEFDPEKGSVHFGEERNDGSHLSEKVLAVKELFDSIFSNPKMEVTVNLPEQTITNNATGRTEHFEINAYKKHCLMNGLDDIDFLLTNKDKIEAYEKTNQ